VTGQVSLDYGTMLLTAWLGDLGKKRGKITTLFAASADIWCVVRGEGQGRPGWRIVSGRSWWFVDVDCGYMFMQATSTPVRIALPAMRATIVGALFVMNRCGLNYSNVV
jgi:hypothetical protein